MRHAIEVRDRCCRFPGCDHRGYLDAHHLVHDTAPVRIDPTDRLEHLHERPGLHLNARTNESLWEGPGGDLSAIIEYLAHLDHHNPPATA